MALDPQDTGTDDEAQAQPAAAPSPALQDFQSAFTHPDAQDWAGEVSTRLNDYFQRRQLADNNAATGQQFVNDVDQFKSGMVKMVQADPHAVHTALDIVPPTISGIISNMPGVPDAEDHHAAITGHMQSEIAAAAVTKAAETHEDLARSMLSDDRIKSVLGDDNHAALSNYTDMQASARERDAVAARGQAAAVKAEIADQSGRNYLGALVDPNNGTPRSPPGWNQAIMADMRVPPQDKVALFNAHEQLGQNGDAQTDPHALVDMVGRLANGTAAQRDLYPMVGSRMSLADVGTLSQALRQPEAAGQLHDTLQSARRQIAPNGDIAEVNAFGRFVNWLMPQVRKGAILDPTHEDWVGHAAANFGVTGNDLFSKGEYDPSRSFAANATNPAGVNKAMGMVGPGVTKSVKSLGEIFGNPVAKAGPPLKDYMADYEANQARTNPTETTAPPLGPKGKDYMADYEANQGKK